jgi:hypothetical protein
MTTHQTLTMSEDEYLRASENSEGICLACEAVADGVEPDARQYKCGSCGALEVYGVEELVMMGNVEVTP